jgi:hypothetical protein
MKIVLYMTYAPMILEKQIIWLSSLKHSGTTISPDRYGTLKLESTGKR